MSDKSLKKYYSRLATEGIIKALLLGASIGFCALAILGGLYWLMAWKSVWICLLVWGAVSLFTAVLLYRWKFQPTTKYIARRVDDLGLHERILTMTELEGDESYIAKRQREDALAALDKVRPELLQIGVSTRTVLFAVLSGLLGACLAVVAFLGAAGLIPTGQQLLHPDGPNGPLVTYQITYGVQDGMGAIQGNTEQTVTAGEKSEQVVAIAAEGWAFVRWTDGNGQPNRSDEATANATYLAVFIEVNPGYAAGLGDDEPDDAPGEERPATSDPDKDAEQGNEAAGKYEEINQIIDNKTYYGNVYDEAYEEAMGELGGEEYSEDEKSVAGGYFDNIEKDETSEENN